MLSLRDMPTSGAADSPQARSLLAALEDFVKPLVYECMTSGSKLESLRMSRTPPKESVEHKLVDCLKELIAETVYNCRTILSQDMSHEKITASPSLAALIPTGGNLSRVSKDGRPHILPSQFRSYFRRELSSKIRSAVSFLPTRLLAFDLIGTTLQLVDHREAVAFLENKILEAVDNRPDFIAKWTESVHLRTKADISSGALLEELVNEHSGYSILSHTWSKERSGEVTFQNWAARLQNIHGYSKISNFCRVSAENYGYCLSWIDTCCINKESSAELDEAIRSMYKWYRNAAVCIIYLSETDNATSLSEDSWFTRGWTLQELVAPWRVVVYNKHWNEFTNKNIHDDVAHAARIRPKEMKLFRQGQPELIPISRRLQMASRRRVTREEDSAYSLMGLLNVSISTAYGEGSQRAFTRLMRELLNTTPHILDLFNHGYEGHYESVIPSTVTAYNYRSAHFDLAAPVNGISSKLDTSLPSNPFLLTHVGLRMQLLLVPGLLTSNRSRFKPKGHLYGKWAGYQLLDSRLYTGDYEASAETRIFGVVNFSLENGKVTISRPCLSIPLVCENATLGSVRSTNQVKVASCSKGGHLTPSFTLSSSEYASHKTDLISVAEDNLEYHGLQHVTLYL